MLLAVSYGWAGGGPHAVSTPLGELPTILVQRACARSNVVVGTVASVHTYLKPTTIGGQPSGAMVYSRITLQVERDVKGTNGEVEEFQVGGGHFEGRDLPVRETSIQPVVGARFAVAFTPLGYDAPMWPKGTNMVTAVLPLRSDLTLPLAAEIRGGFDAVCSRLALDDP